MMLMKKLLPALLLCLLSYTATCQQKGHFILDGGTSVIIGDKKPSVLMYSLEAGISYDLLQRLRLKGSIGGFRNVMSFDRTGWIPETANGPLVRLGADYILLPEDKRFRPLASFSAGYRLRIPPEADSSAMEGIPVQPDGAFLCAALGADIRIENLTLGFSVTGELTHSLRPAAGVSIRILLP